MWRSAITFLKRAVVQAKSGCACVCVCANAAPTQRRPRTWEFGELFPCFIVFLETVDFLGLESYFWYPLCTPGGCNEILRLSRGRF